PRQHRGGRQRHRLGQLQVGDAPVLLQLGQDAAVGAVQVGKVRHGFSRDSFGCFREKPSNITSAIRIIVDVTPHAERMNPTSRTPFAHFFEASPLARSPLRQAITAAARLPEPDIVPLVLEGARAPADLAPRIQALALRIAGALRERKAGGGRAGLVQNLLQQYALSSQEGVALMCLAEALLRIPDAATRDALIRDKIAQGQWQTHLGKSPSLFVNAATWGLLVTGKLVATHSESGLSAALG